MKLSYYPGCSLEGVASDYARSIDTVFKNLGIDLIEIEDWSCCGATAAHSLSEMMAVALPARNLAAAEKSGLDIIAPCARCFNSLRFSQQMIKRQLFDIPWQVSGEIQVHDMTRFLAEPSMIKLIKERIRKPLDGLKVVCYYGCQMVRPPKITGFTDYENPQTLDRIAAAIGAEVIDWSYSAQRNWRITHKKDFTKSATNRSGSNCCRVPIVSIQPGHYPEKCFRDVNTGILFY